MEVAHEKRIRSIQASFSEEIHKVITLKEEEAKYVQSEKELLENRIYELEEAIAGFKGEIEEQTRFNEAAEKSMGEAKK
jgi:hypothetical protein